jgi:uncharacterized membrane protein
MAHFSSGPFLFRTINQYRMENNQHSNWSTPNTSGMGMEQDIPGANSSMILGIVGLFLSLCAGCGLIGFIISIVAFVKGKNAVSEYEANPTAYAQKSFQQAKAGKILGLIGLILGIIVIGLVIILLITGMLADAMD